MDKNTDSNIFKVENEERKNYYLIRIKGRLAAENILTMRKILEEALEAGRTRILVDISAVEYIDSMGIGLIVNFSKKIREAKGRLVLANPTRVVNDVIEVSGTGSLLDIRRDVADPDQAFA